MSSTTTDDFYVGYLPLPQSHRKALRVCVAVIGLIILGSAGLLASQQRNPGSAVWNDGHVMSLTGVCRELPYPMLVFPEHPDHMPVCLVELGKLGAQERTKGLDGKTLECRGWALERDGRKILELVGESDAISVVDEAVRPKGPITRIAQLKATGEVVDYKCYLGAMKPGDGKAHKACAMLCVSRGIPATFITANTSSQTPDYFVLVDASLRPVIDQVLELSGEPVEVSGWIVESEGLKMLELETISRPAISP